MINVLARFCCLESTHVPSAAESELRHPSKPSVQSQPRATPAPAEGLWPAGCCLLPAHIPALHLVWMQPLAAQLLEPTLLQPQFQAPKPAQSWSRAEKALSVFEAVVVQSGVAPVLSILRQWFLKEQSRVPSRAAWPCPPLSCATPAVLHLPGDWPSWEGAQQNKRGLFSFGF